MKNHSIKKVLLILGLGLGLSATANAHKDSDMTSCQHLEHMCFTHNFERLCVRWELDCR